MSALSGAGNRTFNACPVSIVKLIASCCGTSTRYALLSLNRRYNGLKEDAYFRSLDRRDKAIFEMGGVGAVIQKLNESHKFELNHPGVINALIWELDSELPSCSFEGLAIPAGTSLREIDRIAKEKFFQLIQARKDIEARLPLPIGNYFGLPMDQLPPEFIQHVAHGHQIVFLKTVHNSMIRPMFDIERANPIDPYQKTIAIADPEGRGFKVRFHAIETLVKEGHWKAADICAVLLLADFEKYPSLRQAQLKTEYEKLQELVKIIKENLSTKSALEIVKDFFKTLI